MKSLVDCLFKKICKISKAGVYVLIFIAFNLSAALAYGGTGGKDILSVDERAWLEKNQSQLVLAVETGYAPFVFIDSKGQTTGLAHDYIHLLESNLGVHFNQLRFSSLDEIFKKVHSGEVHIVNAVTNTPARAKFLSMTEPFISVPNVIVVRKDRSGRIGEHDLQGLKVSLVKSYAITEHMNNSGFRYIPDIVSNDLDALLNVSFGRSDAAVIDLATASYLISEKSITNLRVAGEVAYDIRLSIGTPLNEAVLQGILQKGLNAITDAERLEIKNRWINASGNQNIFKDRQFWMILGSVLAATFAIFAIVLAWNRTLRRQVVLREQAEMSLRESERRLKEAQHNAQIGNWELDIVKSRLLWSDEIFRLFEIEPDKFQASYKGFLNTVHPEDREAVNLAYVNSLENHTPYEITHRLQMPDGRIKWVNERCNSFFDAEGKVIRSIGTVQDITKRKQAEIELKYYKDHLEEEVQTRTADLVLARSAAEAANKAKSVFLTSINHELRTPLNAILGFSSLMRKDKQLRPDQQDYLDIINRSGTHLLTQINDILEISRVEAGRMQLEITTFDLGDVVRDAISMMEIRSKAKGLSLMFEQSSEFPRYIKGDEVRLRQILTNLVGNAIKFTQQGGVAVRLGSRKNSVLHLMIEVEDSGIGISAEDQKRLFQPFEQMAKQAGDNIGTGLGLSLVKQFVELMRGSIRVESTPGKGSLFRVDLPLGEADLSDIIQLQKREIHDVEGLAPGQALRRILIVEDQLENQLLLTQLMERIGFEVKVAEDGMQAVQLFASWQPHLIWMDRRMPVMDGLEATKAIRVLPGGDRVKIVAVTASAFIEQRDEMLKSGMDDFVRKPYRFNEIYDCLAEQLGVKYIYAEERKSENESPPAPLTAEMLAVLPQDIRKELRDALESLDGERIETVVGKVADYDATLHRDLIRLIENFEYPSILEVLGKMG